MDRVYKYEGMFFVQCIYKCEFVNYYMSNLDKFRYFSVYFALFSMILIFYAMLVYISLYHSIKRSHTLWQHVG